MTVQGIGRRKVESRFENSPKKMCLDAKWVAKNGEGMRGRCGGKAEEGGGN